MEQASHFRRLASPAGKESQNPLQPAFPPSPGQMQHEVKKK